MDYKEFKKTMLKDYANIAKDLKNGSLKYQDVLRKYPQAMLILDTADGSYYHKASGLSKAPNGIYPINDPDEDVFMHNIKQDRYSKQQVINAVTDFRLHQANQLDGEDLYDMMYGNSDNMAGTTSSEWTSKHAYYQPDDPLDSKGELKSTLD